MKSKAQGTRHKAQANTVARSIRAHVPVPHFLLFFSFSISFSNSAASAASAGRVFTFVF